MRLFFKLQIIVVVIIVSLTACSTSKSIKKYTSTKHSFSLQYLSGLNVYVQENGMTKNDSITFSETSTRKILNTDTYNYYFIDFFELKPDKYNNAEELSVMFMNADKKIYSDIVQKKEIIEIGGYKSVKVDQSNYKACPMNPASMGCLDKKHGVEVAIYYLDYDDKIMRIKQVVSVDDRVEFNQLFNDMTNSLTFIN